MDTEDTVVNDCSKGKIVEYISAVTPNIERAIFSEALVIEAIDLSYLPAFVISSDEGD
jgi:hypothetical protein